KRGFLFYITLCFLTAKYAKDIFLSANVTFIKASKLFIANFTYLFAFLAVKLAVAVPDFF
ncbi:hypothetical protein, partial [Flavobacterium sp. LAR06]|uniref:hypothetical protein n=1 Tax=Flavobacterium sp. LAR06 TaxID=3064897 RepID=UPI0035BF7853